MIVPDLVAPLRAHRVWGVVETRGGPRLVSITAGFASRRPLWPPYERFEATCLAVRPCGRAVPAAEHGCGIHAFRSPDDAERWARAMRRVRTVILGEVHLWGTVVEGVTGYRAGFAYPAALTALVPRRAERVDLDALAALYGLARDPRAA